MDFLTLDRALAIGLVLLVFAAGFIEVIRSILNLQERRDFLFDFRKKLIEWYNGNCEDQALYNEIIYNSPKAQQFVGGWGTTHFQPPFKNYIYKNWDIILNAIPMINNYRKEYVLHGQADDFMRMVDESLLRCIGDLDEKLKKRRRELRNPIRWLVRGGNMIVSFPIIIFLEFGLISSKIVGVIKNSLLFNLFVFASTALGLIAAVVTIVLGWDTFYAALERVLK